MQPENCAVIVISSHVVRGSVGNRAIVFALETLGLNVWALPTIILPWHPGHGRATDIVPAMNRFSSLICDLESAPWLGSVSAIISGYLGMPDQARCIARLVRSLRERNPGAFYLCDPVIGDTGKLYVAEETAAAIRDELVPLADLVTPNSSELQWLTGTKANSVNELCKASRQLSRSEVLVTSAPGKLPGQIGNLLVSDNNAYLASHAIVADPPKGAGDLLAALFLGHRIQGMRARQSLTKATAAVYQIISDSKRDDTDELALAKYAQAFSDPLVAVDLANISVSDE